jgi:hypothetical protein
LSIEGGKMTPVQRTLDLLKRQGWKTGIVERYVRYTDKDPRKKIRPGERIDLWGIGDITAINKNTICTMLVQVCGTDHSSHMRKLTIDKYQDVVDWLLSGRDNKFRMYSWRKVKAKRGGKQMIYKPRIIEFSLDDSLCLVWYEVEG